MKFKVSEDVDAPQEMVWARFTDFSGFEEDARGRGAILNRVGNWTQTVQGVEWRGEVTVRGKSRPITAKVTQLVPQEICIVDSRIGGMNCHQEIIFVPLSTTVTRVALMLDLSADTLTARLLLQTMKLARGRVLQKLQGVLARQGNAVEAAYRRQNRS
ncbi:SRPBCC family protein [Roseicyclus sp.]|uniref:SRPBCC family protein n=1 Tax=Roseicyclus sp. TaxID=1914329 RepID=UPI003F6966D4